MVEVDVDRDVAPTVLLNDERDVVLDAVVDVERDAALTAALDDEREGVLEAMLDVEWEVAFAAALVSTVDDVVALPDKVSILVVMPPTTVPLHTQPCAKLAILVAGGAAQCVLVVYAGLVGAGPVAKN